jgi:glycerol-3-phosphate acyltransferase PlsX
VGQTAVIERELAACWAEAPEHEAADRGRLEVVEAPEVIEMADRPSVALRGKANSSMVVGVRRVAEGAAEAFVSAGNTGAQMAASLAHLKLLPGLNRPAIGAVFPTATAPVLVLDAGANMDCSPEELVQFAHIGTVYARALLGRDRPAVGLLSVGEEPEKGNAAVKEAHKRLQQAGLHFLGNVEGRDIPAGRCDRGPIDVVVCDGFTGNVVLKFFEAVAPMLIGRIAAATGADLATVSRALAEVDPEEHGGAPLLGVRGVSIIAHGKSSPRAITNAILVAARAVASGMTAELEARLAEGAASRETAA